MPIVKRTKSFQSLAYITMLLVILVCTITPTIALSTEANLPTPRQTTTIQVAEEWVGLGMNTAWPKDTKILFKLSRAIQTKSKTLIDGSFAYDIRIDEQSMRILDDKTIQTYYGEPAEVTWENNTLTIPDMPRYGQIENTYGEFEYRITELIDTKKPFTIEYEIHGEPLENTTYVPSGGKIVNTIGAVTNYELPDTHSQPFSILYIIGLSCVILSVCTLHKKYTNFFYV